LNGLSFSNFFKSLFAVFDTYILNAINDSSHVSVIIFSLLIGGIVAIISRNGGMKGIVNILTPYANNSVRGQLITWFMGLLIFFDDYANTLVVGNTLRPVTDKLNISREKLSYIVDSTAAPIAAVAFITTWIGAELGFIDQALDIINKDTTNASINLTPYSVFLKSLSYSFYPLLTICFILMVILLKRDFGPMYKAENRARTTGQVLENATERGHTEVDDALKALNPVQNSGEKAWNATLPIITLIGTVIAALFITGSDESIWADESLSLSRKLSTIIGNADSYVALIWGSAAGVMVAVLLTVTQKIMKISAVFETLLDGFKTMIPAITILILAWSIGNLTGDLNTADYLAAVFTDKISPYWFAEITFILAAITAFSTGTSWGTMTILYPLVLPLCWNVCTAAGIPVEDMQNIFFNTVSVVLAGAVFGDHCSPLSDTTILSSMATSTPHMDHVKTQIPYAIVVAVVSVFICSKMSGAGIPAIFNFLTGLIVLFLIIRFFGKKLENT
ncbi:MAG: Na+/H+ antiporter NhaC family protein, partial [Bacteroidia bacterium]|nr:Na+/H+ antiporter NhaC family protein [Bacteroidia bacterium]